MNFCANVDLGANGNGAVVGGYDGARNRQAETTTWAIRVTATIKSFKQEGNISLIDAGARVNDGDDEVRGVLVEGCGDTNGAIRRGVA